MKRIILVLIVLLNSSCTDDQSLNDETIKGELQGSWRWVASTGSIAGITITPENSGKTMSISFTEDDNFKKFIDGEEVYYSPFVLTNDDDKINIQYTTFALFESQGLGFDHQVNQMIEFEDENKINMIDPCCDNFVFTFVRILASEPF